MTDTTVFRILDILLIAAAITGAFSIGWWLRGRYERLMK